MMFTFLTMVHNVLNESTPAYHSDINPYHSFSLLNSSNTKLTCVEHAKSWVLRDLHFSLFPVQVSILSPDLDMATSLFSILSPLECFLTGTIFTRPNQLPPLPEDFLYPVPLHYFCHGICNLSLQLVLFR